MSLLSEYMEEFSIVSPARVPDGEGGYITVWEDRGTVEAAIVQDQSLEARIAEKDGFTATYTVTTKRAVVLGFHTVLKRKSDGAIFRITANHGDRKTPKSASIDMSQTTAERWELTE